MPTKPKIWDVIRTRNFVGRNGEEFPRAEGAYGEREGAAGRGPALRTHRFYREELLKLVYVLFEFALSVCRLVFVDDSFCGKPVQVALHVV